MAWAGREAGGAGDWADAMGAATATTINTGTRLVRTKRIGHLHV